MADITMCVQRTCTWRSRCFRYRAVPDSLWQSYSLFGEPGKEGCTDWSPIAMNDRVRLTGEVDAELDAEMGTGVEE